MTQGLVPDASWPELCFPPTYSLQVFFLVTTLHHDPMLTVHTVRQDVGNVLRVSYDPARRLAILGGSVYTNGKYRGQGLCRTTLNILLASLDRHAGPQPYTVHVGLYGPPTYKTNVAAQRAYTACGAEVIQDEPHSVIMAIRRIQSKNYVPTPFLIHICALAASWAQTRHQPPPTAAS